MKRKRVERATVGMMRPSPPPPLCYLHEHAVEDVQRTIRDLLDTSTQHMLALTCTREWALRRPYMSKTDDPDTHGRWHAVHLAARAGHLQQVTWAMAYYRVSRKLLVDGVLTMAARYGHLSILGHFCMQPRKRFVLDTDTMLAMYSAAAGGGSMIVLQWLWLHFQDAVRHGRDDALIQAARYGEIPAIVWLFLQKPHTALDGRLVPISDAIVGTMLCEALRNEHWGVVDWCRATFPLLAQRRGPQLYKELLVPFAQKAMQWLVDTGKFPIPDDLIITYIAKTSCVQPLPPADVVLVHLQWLRSLVFHWQLDMHTTLVNALKWGIPVVKWLRDVGHFPWSYAVTLHASCHCAPAVMEWLLNSGCLADPANMMTSVIRHGRFDMLKYFVQERHLDNALLRETKQKCLLTAAYHQHWKTVQWLYECGQGYALSPMLLDLAYKQRNRDMCIWLLAFDCPMNPPPLPPPPVAQAPAHLVNGDDDAPCMSDDEFDSMDRE